MGPYKIRVLKKGLFSACEKAVYDVYEKKIIILIRSFFFISKFCVIVIMLLWKLRHLNS